MNGDGRGDRLVCTATRPVRISAGSKRNFEEFDNLPDSDVLAQKIVEDLERALEQFYEIAADLSSE